MHVTHASVNNGYLITLIRKVYCTTSSTAAIVVHHLFQDIVVHDYAQVLADSSRNLSSSSSNSESNTKEDQTQNSENGSHALPTHCQWKQTAGGARDRAAIAISCMCMSVQN